MNIEKAQWTTDGNTVRMTMPLQKVDEEKRIVSGFATMDSVDTSGDVVLASASEEAFANFRGNIRLMHQPIPAGKLVNFRKEDYYDQKTQKFYTGIWVDVYVSKGAENIWEMVLDGTLTGFSIGGAVTDQESQYVKDAGRSIRFIKSYDLIELSLVDSPANQLCNVFSIQKAADGSTQVEGMLAQVATENVFFCAKDEVAFTSTDEAKACNVCGTEAKNIGWFESDGGDKTEKVNAIVADFTKATETAEGRENEMADDVVETEVAETETEVTPEEVVAEAEEAAEEIAEEIAEAEAELEELEAEVEAEVEALEADAEASEEATEEVEETDEVETEEETATPDLAKMFEELSTGIKKALEANQADTEAALVKVQDRLAEIDSVATKIEELSASHAELTEKFNAINSQIENVEKRFDTVEKGVGIKKSGDLGGSTVETKLEKSNGGSFWSGRFFGSVDNL
jgi:hypothetical protein